MSLNKFWTIIVLCFISNVVNAQIKVLGFIKDAENGEALIGAYVLDGNSNGVCTNNYGYFSISIAEPNNKLTFSYVGYKQQELVLNALQDTNITIFLSKDDLIDEVVIAGGFNRLQSNLTGIETMTPKMVNTLPTVMGEPDIIKTITLLPGVSFGNEAAAGYFVRGGSSDQNLLLIDGVPVYNPYHLHGYFSVFNTDAINKATLYKGAVPAKFGGRLSSVLDINMREGNAKKFGGKVTLGTVTTKLLLEGPIVKDKMSFLITGRRSMLDVYNKGVSSLLSWFSGMSQVAENVDVNNYYFYDYNVKVNHKLNRNNRLFFNLYSSVDNFENKESDVSLKSEIIWKNLSTSLRWNYIYSNKLFSNFTVYHTKYNYSTKDAVYYEDSQGKLENSIQYGTGISDYSGKLDFTSNMNKHSLKFGGQYLYQIVAPDITKVEQIVENNNLAIDTTINSAINTHSAIFYLEDEYKLFEKATINTGLHFSNYFTEGKLYPSLQPRFSVNYKPISKLALKASYTRMVQPLHLLSTTWSGDPSDIWVPSTNKIKPESANQYALGINFKAQQFNIAAEAYYRTMNNLIDYKEGASHFNTEINWQDKVEIGTGKVHGFEFSVNKERGKLTGLLSYTYSKSTRQFQNINRGKEFPYTYDRTHSVSVALMYNINKKFALGANWVFATGQPVTISNSYVVSSFEYNAEYYRQYNSINNTRLPNYHRLDVCANYTKTYPKFNYKISTGVYNVYNRQNPYSVYDTGESLYVGSLLGFLPYLTISLSFNSK